MAKKALLDVLEQTIGKYVKNLDAESLNVAVWSGKIELHSLQLDVDSVNAQLDKRAAEAPNLAVPFRVVSGSFHSFQVDVPWAHITSRPVVLRAQGLSVEVEPHDRAAEVRDLSTAAVEDEITRAAKLRETRDALLDTANSFRVQAYAVRKIALSNSEDADNSCCDGKYDSSKSSSSFSSRLVRRIIENIQIEILDVHVSLSDSDGYAGVVLQSLSLVTTDKDGQQKFVDRTAVNMAAPPSSSDVGEMSFLHKRLRIDGLGVYLDEDKFMNARSRRSLGTIGEGDGRDFESQSSSASSDLLDHSYILAPLSFESKLRQADSNVCIDYAKYLLKSHLSSLSIILTRSQLDFARRISKVMSSPDTGPTPLFPEYRPLVRVKKGNTKEWWKYALRSIGRMNGKRLWYEFFLAYRKRKEYIPLFKRQSHYRDCSWIKPLSAAEMDKLIEIEHDRSITVEGLMAWRNIADAQIDKEREKIEEKNKAKTKKTTSYYSYIFGSSTASATEPTDDETESDADQILEAPPIQLSPDEMKELEDIAKADFSEKELSKESKLCDVRFVLDALKVELVAYDLRHIASLDMGKVSMDFDAAKDGAFSFNFDLHDLEIFDRVTPKSLFPSVLRMIDKSLTDRKHRKALHFDLSKSSTGDQSLSVSIAAFEAVPSKLVAAELQQFFRESPMVSRGMNTRKANPLLAQSISGSVDLFYDAEEGSSFRASTVAENARASYHEPHSLRAVPAYNLSNALFEAWKDKLEKKVSWIIDIDIYAPILLVPEASNDPRANILVFNLGHLQAKYGKFKPSAQVHSWFEGHPRESLTEATYDSGSLSIDDLTFGVQKASSLIAESRNGGEADAGVLNIESPIITPIGVLVDFAIESIGHEGRDRACIIGVIPEVSFKISPSQLSRVLPIVHTWKEIALADSRTRFDDVVSPKDEVQSLNSTNSHVNNLASPSAIDTAIGDPTDCFITQTVFPTLYSSIGLQHLSMTLVDNEKVQVESHLVSVYASVVHMSDGGLAVGLRMGWFWVLDQMEQDFPRRQRFVAHSNLPKLADAFAASDDYDVLEDLRNEGVFESGYGGSTELADIRFESLSQSITAPAKDFGFSEAELKETRTSRILDATFRSLFVHWNPIAIRALTSVIDAFVTASDDDRITEVGTLISSPSKRDKANILDDTPVNPLVSSSGELLIRAKMETLEIVLNSARDDMPLFILTVAGSRVCILPRGQGTEVSLSLGDLRITTPPDAGATLPCYRTLLGLAADTTKSLLTVKYCMGSDVVQSSDSAFVDTDNIQALGVVELSPMRMIYIHPQVLVLVDYITDGILGTLTARAATSAAEAAKQIAQSVSGNSMYIVRATSLGFSLPQAAHKGEVLDMHMASLDVKYLSGPSGSSINVELSDMTIMDLSKTSLLETPILLAVKVFLPIFGVGGPDEQAMRMDLDMSAASFSISKAQYTQIVHTLSENVGEQMLFLREDEVPGLAEWKEDGIGSLPAPGEMTHAGNEFVERIRRMKFIIRINELAIKLYTGDFSDPLVRLAAVEAVISMNHFPDIQSSAYEIILKNLVCEDCRASAEKRQYRYLFDQRLTHDHSKGSSIFQLNYKSEQGQSEIDLAVGSPEFVLIPDAISEITSFVSTGKSYRTADAPKRLSSRPIKDDPFPREVVDVHTSQGGDAFEARLRSGNTSKLQFSAQTGICSIVLVDLGSQLQVDRSSMTSTGVQLTETMVFQGIFAASISSESDNDAGTTVASDFRLQADNMEVFTCFGREMKSPVQILEPASGSIHGSLKTGGDFQKEIGVQVAALTPLDFSISMHDAALFMAISNSLALSVSLAEEKRNVAYAEDALSPKEQERIAHLASALENMGADEGINHQESSSNLETDSVASSSFYYLDSMNPLSSKFQIKLTMPEVRVTAINDLQGLDEALFRLSLINFVAGGELASPKTLFDFHCNTSILADYFDTSVNLWSSLLTKQWEITAKGNRGPSRRFKSDRLSSTLDLESFPCHISFSEQFLMSLASASRMWSIYSAAINGPDDEKKKSTSFKQSSVTTTAARNLVTSFPHAIANHCGIDVSFTLESGSIEDCDVPAGSIHYFRFDPPKGIGYGGKRSYGQDARLQKLVAIDINNTVIAVNMDTELGLPGYAHDLGDNLIVITSVTKEGKTTVLHLSSKVEIRNRTLLPFQISFVDDDKVKEIGKCPPVNRVRENSVVSSVSQGHDSKNAGSFNIPAPMLVGFCQAWESYGQANLKLQVSPVLEDINSKKSDATLMGIVQVIPSLHDLKRTSNGMITSKSDIICRSSEQLDRESNPLSVSAVVRARLVSDQHVCVSISLEPKAVIENKMPVPIKVRTPMPQTFSLASASLEENHEVTYDLDVGGKIEVFTPGPSIAVSFRTRDKPVAGLDLGWLDGGWVDLPLIKEFSLVDPMVCRLPLDIPRSPRNDTSLFGTSQGAETFIVQGTHVLENLAEFSSLRKESKKNIPTTTNLLDDERSGEVDNTEPAAFFLTVCNYGVDHTGNVLFEQVTADNGADLSAQLSLVVQAQSSYTHTNRHHLKKPSRGSGSFLDGVDDLVDSLVDSSTKRTYLQTNNYPPCPLGTFVSPIHRRRITLLPNANAPLRLLQMTMEGEDGMSRSLPFLLDNLPISQSGGASTVPIFGIDRKPTGHFVYRKLINEHQSAVHIVPEYVVFNGSKDVLLVKERDMPEVMVDAGSVGQLRALSRPSGLEISLNFIELQCQTRVLQAGALGLRVALLRTYDGVPVGSVYVQTVIDTQGESRLVVKVGAVAFGSNSSPRFNKDKGFFSEDFCRFRFRLTELQLVLNEVNESQSSDWKVGRTFRSPRNQASPRFQFRSTDDSRPSSEQTNFPRNNRQNTRRSVFNKQRSLFTDLQQGRFRPEDRGVQQIVQQPIMAVVLSRSTIDFQRVFKDVDQNSGRYSIHSSPERSQLSVIVHNVQIKDLTPNSHFPLVFDCSSDISFFDLCIRSRGPLNADLVKVDLFDLNLAHNSGRSEKMVLTTSESYLWRLLDLTNRILAASGEVGGYTLAFEEDEEHGGYMVKIEDSARNRSKNSELQKYTPPQVDTLYDIGLTRVSPFTIVVSFRRSADTSRYKKSKTDVATTAAIANYFTRKLKFTIDKAELNFSRYEDKTLKGPPDRLLETLSTVYVGRMKFKVVSLLSAASLQDWRYLAARDTGDDEYMEGDILRATGNLAGKSANLVFKKVGQGFGGGVIALSAAIGDSIEEGTSAIGARQFGSGVSSVVNGVGHGLGDTVSGLGTGTGKLLQGAGQGVGHAIGGISGGALQIGKGIGRGITTGDGKAVVEGLSKGVSSIGGGIANGAESAVMGAADGFLAAGKGLMSGAQSLGAGIGGAFRGRKPTRFVRDSTRGKQPSNREDGNNHS